MEEQNEAHKITVHLKFYLTLIFNVINISQHSNPLSTCKTEVTCEAYRKLEMTGTTDPNTHLSLLLVSSFHTKF